jgi:hypothetical protein
MTDASDVSLADCLGASDGAYGLPERSGGHTWREDVQGRVCAGCGRRWAEVVGATTAHVGQKHWAHSQHLVDWEQKQLEAEVDWLWSTIVDAASSGAR